MISIPRSVAFLSSQSPLELVEGLASDRPLDLVDGFDHVLDPREKRSDHQNTCSASRRMSSRSRGCKPPRVVRSARAQHPVDLLLERDQIEQGEALRVVNEQIDVTVGFGLIAPG